MTPFKISVFLKKKCLNDFYLVDRKFSKVTQFYFDIGELSGGDFCSDLECESTIMCNGTTTKALKVTMDGYLCSLFQYVLQTSPPYRTCFINNISRRYLKIKENVSYSVILICVKLVSPKADILDYKGNEMFEILCLERRELDNAMAWLSTLGGAFSALGDNIQKCATIAGKISIRQLEIALRLGDPFLVARCKLYAALSLIQRHKFKLAKQLIKEQYLIATLSPIKDNKLKSMCLGIWTKLKYDRARLKELNKQHIVGKL